MNTVNEEKRREEQAHDQVSDRQVCDEEVEGSVDGFVRRVRVNNHSIAERTYDDGKKVQRTNKHCRGCPLVVMLLHFVVWNYQR